jgi:uncharacterized coiled-coil protein SlyX
VTRRTKRLEEEQAAQSVAVEHLQDWNVRLEARIDRLEDALRMAADMMDSRTLLPRAAPGSYDAARTDEKEERWTP